MTAFIARNMPEAQTVFDAVCSTIFIVCAIAIYCMVTAPWPQLVTP